VIQHFALLFGAGLLGLLPAVDHRRIPASYFRLVVLLALPALLLALSLALRSGADRPTVLAMSGLTLAACVYLGCILGERMAAASVLSWSLLALAQAALAAEARSLGTRFGLLSAMTGAGLLGSVLLAMLLGHAYLNIPGLPIVHLRRLGWLFGAFLAARLLIVGIAAAILLRGTGPAGLRALDAEAVLASDLPLLGMRVALGVVVPGILAVLVDRTARIRSTQSATGLLYVALVFVLFGELMASYLWAASGVPA
jgi:hypothetical protein